MLSIVKPHDNRVGWSGREFPIIKPQDKTL